MTMIVWAGCENFGLMMADRRAYAGKVVPDSGGVSSLGHLALAADTTKALVSDDARDIYGLSGSTPAFDMVRRVLPLHADVADAQLFARVQPPTPLSWALDSNVAPILNSVVHSYRHEGRLICCRTDWAPTQISRVIVVARSDQITINAAGSGAEHLQAFASRDPAKLGRVALLVDDWLAVRTYLLEAFAEVARVDPGVGPDVDSWVMLEGPVWKKQDPWTPLKDTTCAAVPS